MTHSPVPQDSSSDTPSGNDSPIDPFSPFDTFHAPLDSTTGQSIEDQLAAMQQVSPASPAPAMTDRVAETAADVSADKSDEVSTETSTEVSGEMSAEVSPDSMNESTDAAASDPPAAIEVAITATDDRPDSMVPPVAVIVDEEAAIEQTDNPADNLVGNLTANQADDAADRPADAASQAPAEEPPQNTHQDTHQVPETQTTDPQNPPEEFVSIPSSAPAIVAEAVEIADTVDTVANEKDADSSESSLSPDLASRPAAVSSEPQDIAPAATVAANTTSQISEQPAVEISRPTAPQSEPQEQVAASKENGFLRLDLRPEIQQAVEELGYDQPTDVQAEIIPHLLAGRDVLAQSQTGTGKTAAFALPILSLIALPTKLPQVIVLTPTRELAMQVAESFSRYGQHLPGFRVAAVYGGTGYDGQIRQLRRGAPIVVGTPGRVIDLIKKGILDLSLIGCCVLDEADEMLNMGFLDDVEFVLQQTPEERQVALFSATMPGPIQSIARNYQTDPVRITIKRKTMTADAIRQRAVIVQHRDKLETLTRLLDVEPTDGVIIFTKTREATVTVAEHLVREGLSAIALNGDMPQNVRERAIDQLKSGKLDILVATDVAARGLDVSRISHVFNFDVPQDSETYVHRIGRTGRAGRKGEAIILLSNSQRYKLKQIERVTRKSIEVVARPSADDINNARIQRFKQKIAAVIEQEDVSFFAGLLQDYATESGQSFEQIAAALAVIQQNGRPFLAEDRPRRERNRREEHGQDRRERGRSDRFGDRDRDNRQRAARPQRRAGRVEAGMERYRIEVGHDDNVKPGNIVGAVANEGGIEGEFIGPINIYDNYSTIDLPEGMPNDVYNVLRQVRVAGKPLQLKKATESDNHGDSSGGRQRRGPRFQGRGKPPRRNRKFDKKPRRHGHG